MEIWVYWLSYWMKFLCLNVINLDVSKIAVAPSCCDCDALAFVHRRGSKAMDPRWCDSNWKSELSLKTYSVDAPPAILGLAVKVDCRIAGPCGPSPSLTNQNTLARLGRFEGNYISVELVEFTPPRTGAIGCDGDEVSGSGSSGTVVNGSVGS